LHIEAGDQLSAVGTCFKGSLIVVTLVEAERKATCNRDNGLQPDARVTDPVSAVFVDMPAAYDQPQTATARNHYGFGSAGYCVQTACNIERYVLFPRYHISEPAI